MSPLHDSGGDPVGATIRPMRASDLDQVIQLLARWDIAPLPPSADISNPERTAVIVGNTVVAEDAGRIVGVRSFIQHSSTEAEGASLAVDPAFHKHGIGKALMMTGYRQMLERGIRKVRAETDRPEVVAWLCRNFGHRVIGTIPKRHIFGNKDVDHWTMLELELDERLFIEPSGAEDAHGRK